MPPLQKTLTFLLHTLGCICGLGPPATNGAILSASRDRQGPMNGDDNSPAANGYSILANGSAGNYSGKEKLSNGVINPHNYGYIINEPHTCQEDVFLVVFICSRPDNFEQRSAIRRTWASQHSVGGLVTKYLFILGELHPEGDSIQARIKNESTTHRDVIQESFVDSYANLTLKSIAILKWVHSYCEHAQYLLKTDDDMYINIPVLIKDLFNTVHKRFIMGDIIAGAQPIRDMKSKWYTPPRLYPYSRYPKYISGTAYVISGDLVADLYSSALRTELFWIEDVYITGLCAEKANAMHIFNGKFGYKRRLLSPCLFKVVITGHKMKPSELDRIWREITKPDLVCDYAKVHWNVLS